MSNDQSKFSVGLVQMALSKNQNENLDKAVSKIEEAAKSGADVICLPELFACLNFSVPNIFARQRIRKILILLKQFLDLPPKQSAELPGIKM